MYSDRNFKSVAFKLFCRSRVREIPVGKPTGKGRHVFWVAVWDEISSVRSAGWKISCLKSLDTGWLQSTMSLALIISVFISILITQTRIWSRKIKDGVGWTMNALDHALKVKRVVAQILRENRKVPLSFKIKVLWSCSKITRVLHGRRVWKLICLTG